MTRTPKLVDQPTQRQLAYLRSLATRTGQTFAYPRTCGQASREIQRLEQAQRSTPTERSIERTDIADAIARGPADADRRAAKRGRRLWVELPVVALDAIGRSRSLRVNSVSAVARCTGGWPRFSPLGAGSR